MEKTLTKQGRKKRRFGETTQEPARVSESEVWLLEFIKSLLNEQPFKRSEHRAIYCSS